jgi:hypothetical protein
MELVLTVLFGTEYGLRLFVSNVKRGQTRLQFVTRLDNIFDLLAICPLIVDAILARYDVDVQVLRVLRAVRLTRVLRLLKMGKHSAGLRAMFAALQESFYILYVLVFITLMLMVFFSSAIYYAERLACPAFAPVAEDSLQKFLDYSEDCKSRDFEARPGGGMLCCAYWCDLSAVLQELPGAGDELPAVCVYSGEDTQPDLAVIIPGEWTVEALHGYIFASVPASMWWSAVTMTTVGYGDMSPVTWGAKLVGGFSMVAGILLIALPVAVIGANFHRVFNRTRSQTRESQDGGPAIKFHSSRLSAFADNRTQREKRVKKGGGALLIDEDGNPREQVKDVKLQRVLLDRRIRTFQNVAIQLKQVQADLRAQHEMEIHARRDTQMKIKTLLCELFTLYPYEKPIQVVDEDEQTAFLCQRSLGLFSRGTTIRELAIEIGYSKALDQFIMLLIIANSVMLALYNYTDPESTWTKLSESTEHIFSLLFTCEFLIKVVARGFIRDKCSYLRDPWNRLDFTVVVSGIVSFVLYVMDPEGESTGLGALRVFRVLRPLRTVSSMPGMRLLVQSVLQSLPRLANVFGMGIFLLSVFAILGVQFWGGVVHRRCRVTGDRSRIAF